MITWTNEFIEFIPFASVSFNELPEAVCDVQYDKLQTAWWEVSSLPDLLLLKLLCDSVTVQWAE